MPLLFTSQCPLLGYFIITASVFVNKKICVIAFSAVGALIILLGARSGGMFIFVSGIFGYYLSLGKKISIKSKIPAIVIAVVFSYIGYCYYATEVLEGRIVSGNNEQILSMSKKRHSLSRSRNVLLNCFFFPFSTIFLL